MNCNATVNIASFIGKVNLHGWSAMQEAVSSFVRSVVEPVLVLEQQAHMGCRAYERSAGRIYYANGFNIIFILKKRITLCFTRGGIFNARSMLKRKHSENAKNEARSPAVVRIWLMDSGKYSIFPVDAFF